METFCANYRREESQAFSSGDFHKRRLLRERVHPRVIGARAMHADRFTIISLHAALCPSPLSPPVSKVFCILIKRCASTRNSTRDSRSISIPSEGSAIFSKIIESPLARYSRSRLRMYSRTSITCVQFITFINKQWRDTADHSFAINHSPPCLDRSPLSLDCSSIKMDLDGDIVESDRVLARYSNSNDPDNNWRSSSLNLNALVRPIARHAPAWLKRETSDDPLSERK